MILSFMYDSTAFVAQVSSLLAVYVLGNILWRLWFHRLRKIPGPRLAAITGWYEFYQDVILDGNYVKEYPKLHEKYGPVVRIAPDHVHVEDLMYYQEVYGYGTRYLKDPNFYETFGVKHSLLMFTNPVEHKERYDIIKSIFSKQKIEKLAPFVSEIVQKGLRRAQESLKQGTPLDIQQVYRCVTVDTITRVLFNKSMNLIESGDSTPPFLESMDTFSDRVQTMKHLPVLNRIALKLPLSLANLVAKGYVQFRLDCEKWIQEVVDRHELGVYCAENGRHTIFDLLLQPNVAKGYKIPTHESLVDEAFIFCFAGTDTTSYALSCSTYYLLTHADKLKRLREELDTVPRNSKGMLEYQDVRNLPYLTAVIKESLRVSSPIPGNLPRVVPAGGAYVGDTFIPPDSIVSVCPRLIHYNADIYKDPTSFIPERWLGPEAGALERWHVPFSKGPRSCVGFNIAYLELYTCLSNFFCLMDMELYDTDEKAMEWRDYGTCRNADHVKVLIKDVK